MPANVENAAVATGLGKVSFHSNTKEGQYQKNVQTTAQLHSFHMLAISCSKSFKLGFNSMWTMNFQMFKMDLEKAEETDQIGHIHWITEKSRKFQKNIINFCFIDYTKAFDSVDHKKLENSSRGGNQTTLPSSWEICMQVKKQQLELAMEQWTGSKLQKE